MKIESRTLARVVGVSGAAVDALSVQLLVGSRSNVARIGRRHVERAGDLLRRRRALGRVLEHGIVGALGLVQHHVVVDADQLRALADARLDHHPRVDQAEHHAHLLVADAVADVLAEPIIETAGEAQAVGVGQVDRRVERGPVGAAVEAVELEQELAVARAAEDLQAEVLPEVVVVREHVVELHVERLTGRLLEGRLERAVAGEAAVLVRGDRQVAVVEVHRRQHRADVARVDDVERHAQLGVEVGAAEVEQVRAGDDLVPRGDLDDRARRQLHDLLARLGRLGEQHRALDGGGDLVVAARGAVPEPVLAGEHLLRHREPVAVVEPAVVDQRHRVDVDRLVVVQRPLHARLDLEVRRHQVAAEAVDHRRGLGRRLAGGRRRRRRVAGGAGRRLGGGRGGGGLAVRRIRLWTTGAREGEDGERATGHGSTQLFSAPALIHARISATAPSVSRVGAL
ncbi:hypothetical protein [Nannocystis pusilla]|uniref:hypothetical protein n=1 Tax=Nannocystis pusilla TaxID=889268 RepID=UPI003DA35D6C